MLGFYNGAAQFYRSVPALALALLRASLAFGLNNGPTKKLEL